jgi:nucleoside-diphosphate-sugar epimerase
MTPTPEPCRSLRNGGGVTDLVHPGARRLWAETLAADDRVLIIGATGWFGRTATALMAGLGNATMNISSRARTYEAGPVSATSVEWQWDAVQRFEPTTIIDCAFLTRDLVSSMTMQQYVQTNSDLTANLLAAARLQSVRRVMTISSGAAVHPVDALTQSMDENPYGRLKREAERALGELAAERGIAAVVARAWSVSGAFVLKPRSYALSDMIMQAAEGAIRITAPMEVFRRYVSVDDLLAVSLAAAEATTPIVDSGGPLVEMHELAEAVRAVVNPAAWIERAARSSAPANRYYSDALQWDSLCDRLTFEPAPLDEQVRVTMNGLGISARR